MGQSFNLTLVLLNLDLSIFENLAYHPASATANNWNAAD